MDNIPLTTVLMSVYNSEKYLSEAIESILNQTFINFEFLIIDDASTDGSLEIIKSYSDTRIRLIQNEENIGLTKSLNRGLKLAKGKYIARMDADDISMPERLADQIKFLDENPDVVLVGAQSIVFDNFIESSYELPYNYRDIKTHLLFHNCIIHSTVFARKDILLSYMYNETFYTSQDYELWSRITEKYQVVNLDIPLVKYRQHSEQIGQKKSELQKSDTYNIQKQMWNRRYNVSPSDFKLIHPVIKKSIFKNIISLKEFIRAFTNILKQASYEVSELGNEYIRSTIINNFHLGYKILKLYIQYIYFGKCEFGILQKNKLLIKLLFKL